MYKKVGKLKSQIKPRLRRSERIFTTALLCVIRFLATRNDQFAGSEEKHHHFWIIKAVDKSRALFWFYIRSYQG